MADKTKLIPFIKKFEGGFSNTPGDRGGNTNSGVTLAVYQSVYGKNKTASDLKKMTNAQWEYIFTNLFWNKWKADEINNQSIANILVDWVWASGTGTIKKVQALFGLKQDGIVGSKTISYLNSGNQKEIFNKIWERRKKFIDGIIANNPSQKKFYKGWMNRLNVLKFSE